MLINFLIVLFCSILLSFCVFRVVTGFWRKGINSEYWSIKGKFWVSRILLERSSIGSLGSSVPTLERLSHGSYATCAHVR
jgi:hypothetical protein